MARSAFPPFDAVFPGVGEDRPPLGSLRPLSLPLRRFTGKWGNLIFCYSENFLKPEKKCGFRDLEDPFGAVGFASFFADPQWGTPARRPPSALAIF